MGRCHGGTGAGRSPSMRQRIFRNSSLGTATSASWKVTYRPWLTTLAPILITLDRLCRSSPERGQRPVLHRLRQGQRPREVAEVVSQGVKLKPDLVVAEFLARQARPPDGILAFLDMLFRCAPLVVKGHHAFGGSGQVGDDEADPGNQFPGMPFNPGDHPALPVQISSVPRPRCRSRPYFDKVSNRIRRIPGAKNNLADLAQRAPSQWSAVIDIEMKTVRTFPAGTQIPIAERG